MNRFPPSRRLTLGYNAKDDNWELREERTGLLIRSYLTKDAATRKGVLERELGRGGGSVVIHRKNGVFEEQRRYLGGYFGGRPVRIE